MTNTITVKGRLVGPTTVELDVPVQTLVGEVRVDVILPVDPISDELRRKKTLELIERMKLLPSRGRTKQDIDRQIQEERDSWESRS